MASRGEVVGYLRISFSYGHMCCKLQGDICHTTAGASGLSI